MLLTDHFTRISLSLSGAFQGYRVICQDPGGSICSLGSVDCGFSLPIAAWVSPSWGLHRSSFAQSPAWLWFASHNRSNLCGIQSLTFAVPISSVSLCQHLPQTAVCPLYTGLLPPLPSPCLFVPLEPSWVLNPAECSVAELQRWFSARILEFRGPAALSWGHPSWSTVSAQQAPFDVGRTGKNWIFFLAI
jgi:hypothetical protein